MAVITIWSDLHCPWSYVAAVRLHHMRNRMAADDVLFDFRAWPHELAFERGLDGRRLAAEMVAAAQLEPTAFSAYQARAWPTTSLPGFEAQKWAYGIGPEAGERFDLALRRAFFLHGHNLGLRHELLQVAENEGLKSESLAEALDDGRFRRQVMEDFVDAGGGEVSDTPYVVLPDGSGHLNPGVSLRWVRDLPIVDADHPAVFEELIQVAAVDL